MDMVTTIRQNFVRSIVQRKITCTLTGKVLDFETCGVVLDKDGDPVDVFDPAALDNVRAILEPDGFKVAVAPFTEAM